MQDRNSAHNSKISRILRLRWIWVIAGFGIFVALILILMPFGMDYGIERYFLANGADQARVADIDFNPFTRRLAVKNLIVTAADEQVLRIARVEVTFVWSPLFKKRLLIERIKLDRSQITIEEQADGRWRIGGLLPETPADTSSEASWGLGLNEVQIQNSRLQFRSANLTSELKIEQTQVRRLRSWLPDRNIRLNLKGQLNDGKLQLQADFSPFGSAATVDASLKLQGLTLSPFAHLITADPRTLAGRLDADLRVQSKYRSQKGFNFNQTGRLVLNQARMVFGDVGIAGEDLTWEGAVRINMPAASDELHISATGQLAGKDGSVNPTPDKPAFRHAGLDWNGKFDLTAKKNEASDINLDGALQLQKFNMAAGDMTLVEENLIWDGNVGISSPTAPSGFRITATGKLAGTGAFMDSPSAKFKLQGNGLNWNGEFTFAAEKQTINVKLDGGLRFPTLEVETSDMHLTEEDLKWNGDARIWLPENSAAHHLTTNGRLESRRQKIALRVENLVLANENLSWTGRFNCGLNVFTEGLAAEGDFSITQLAISDTPKKLRLLASKAVDLKSVTADANTHFSIATAKITGLDVVGRMDSPQKTSLFSAAEVQVDALNLKRLKRVSIESARIMAAKGVLHRKSNGTWRFIEDLKTFLADSGASSPRKPSAAGKAQKAKSPANKTDVRPGIRIGSLEIMGDSVVLFEDETVSPAFRSEMRLQKARLTDVDSYKPEQKSPVAVEAESGKYTRLKLQGNVQAFTERISMDLKSEVKALEMPPLSPYAAETIGYNLISGEMDADIDLKITSGQLEGEGVLKFHHPTLEAVDPQKLENSKGSPIPLNSALKVLRDKKDDIRLTIPISGDVGNPQFSFADAINQAIVKGLSMATASYLKYMLGPYGTAIAIIELGAKVGAKTLTGISLKPLEFQPGVSDLDAAAKEYVDRVAQILKEKEELRVRLCGWATESDRPGPPKPAAATPTASSGTAATAGKSKPGGQTSAQKDARYPLSDPAMLALAQRRADRIENMLVSRHGINHKRIFICKPQIDDSPEAKPRVELVF